jgi:hypothetical protein
MNYLRHKRSNFIKQDTIPILLMLLATGLVALFLVVYLPRNIGSTEAEVLLLLGPEKWPDKKCTLLLVNPQKQEIRDLTDSLIGDYSCYPASVSLDDQTYLLYWSSGSLNTNARIAIYKLSNWTLVVEQDLPLGAIRIVEEPQWQGKDIYFVGIDNKSPQKIYRIDYQTGQVVPYIDYQEGFAIAALLSPNSRHLAYMAPIEGDIQAAHCPPCLGFYQIRDLENETTIALQPLLEESFNNTDLSHCGAKWSPTGQWLAILAECRRPEGPKSVVIFDVMYNEIIDILNANIIYEWVSDTDLVIQEIMELTEDPTGYKGYWSYSTSTRDLRRLYDLVPDDLRGIYRMRFDDWADMGQLGVGRAVRVDTSKEIMIVIVERSETNSLNVTYAPLLDIHGDNFVGTPRWSPSANWIAFDTHDHSAIDTGRDIYILNKAGSLIFRGELLPIAAPDIIWIKP